MSGSEDFRPHWASAPGETIGDILREGKISTESFASSMGLSQDQADDLLLGRTTITIHLARRLTDILGASVEFWMSRDYHYRQDSRRLQADEEGWLRKLPVGDMIKFGWLSPRPLPSEELTACLRFFGVSSVVEWRENYMGLQETAAFRTSPSFESREESVAAWLRRGEIEAEKIECKSWHSERFQESLWQLRSLTWQKDPGRFVPALQAACSENGVAVVVVRSPSGCRASGATRFLTNDKAILQLSFRYLTDDHFWFTFFHEAGHLVLHGRRQFFASQLKSQELWILEGAEFPTTEEEEEANQFAADVLVPQEFQQELLTVTPNRRGVVRLAQRAGVSPGVIVGQMQHNGRIGYGQLNGLKRHFAWEA